MAQKVLEAYGEYTVLDTWFAENHVKCAMLVCGRSIQHQKIHEYLEKIPVRLGIRIVQFMDFQPNPLYENVLAGVKTFRDESCDAIIAVGGGSAMDVAKCIKLYAGHPGNGENGMWLHGKHILSNIPFLAMPTTSGTGSEATQYAVIYYNGEKQSITDINSIPNTVLLDPSCLKSVPLYQKKATMCDALCHAIESYWSINSSEESQILSRTAISEIMESMEGYLANTEEGNYGMLKAAHTAGKAINMTQTTAGHAMCYKITSLFGCAHGHAAILCVRILYPWMIRNVGNCTDIRGTQFLQRSLDGIAECLGCTNAASGAKKIDDLFHSLEFEIPRATSEQFTILKNSVNPVRLKNHPIALDSDTIDVLYHEILNYKQEAEA